MRLHGIAVGCVAAAGLALTLLFPAKASADVLDCRVSCFGTFHGAVWASTNQGSQGTGSIDSFVRLQNTGVEDGHNSSGVTVNDEKGGAFTHDIQLQDIPVFSIGANTYYEFLLDVNNFSSSPLLSLNEVQICTSALANQVQQDACPGTVRYQMGSFNTTNDASTYVLINYALDGGSGNGDLFMYIPTSNFTGLAGSTYVYLFSQFGAAGQNTPYGDTRSNDGFEEWATRICTLSAPCTPPVPEPASLVLLGTGLLGLGFAARRRFSL